MKNAKGAAAERKAPDWPLWLTVKGAALWELVDLSLNREPDFLLGAADGDQRHERLATIRRHAAAGSTVLRQPEGCGYIGEPGGIYQQFTVESFAEWAVSVVGWSVPAELTALAVAVAERRDMQRRAAATMLGRIIDMTKHQSAPAGERPAPQAEPMPPRIPLMQTNRERVLRALRGAGFELDALPPRPNGTACPAKAAARAGAGLEAAAFEHAWKALFAEGMLTRRP